MEADSIQEKGRGVAAHLSSSPWLWRWGIPLAIFLLAFLVRAFEPISRPMVWGDRAYHFGNAILSQDWGTTYQRYHPGVTVMWLSGIGLQLFSYWQGGLTGDQLLGIAPTRPGVLTASVSAAVIPLALAIAACVALMYVLLRRLLGTRVALVATLLIALDPFLIGYSKVVHPDALLTTLMFVTALFLLVFLQDEGRRYLILSGVFAGLSFLTKSPSLFLIPYAGLVIGVAYLWSPVNALFSREGAGRSWRAWGRGTGAAMAIMGVWLLVAAIIFVMLWPAMWVKARDVLMIMADRIFFHTTSPHPNPVYFNGVATREDPGIGFYLATIAWKTTLITLPMLFAGLLLLFRHWRTRAGRVLLALFAYALFFLLQMSLGEFKQIPYILPVAPALSTIAAFGLVTVADWIAHLPWWRNGALVTRVVLGLAIGVQAVIVAVYHPHFGTHYNALLGGGRVAQQVLPLQDNGEGLEIAARYLNELPHGQDETAAVPKRNAIVFRREFTGRTTTDMVPWAAYRVYSVNEVMRGMLGEEWQARWEVDRQEEPMFTVSFHGTPYVWVYGKPPADPAPNGIALDVQARLGEEISLKSAEISDMQLEAGEPLTVVLYWQTDARLENDYVVFTHLLSPDTELVAQHDSVPLLGIRPTTTWLPGEVLEDVHTLAIPPDLAPGTYALSTGIYHEETLERLPAYRLTGEPWPNNRIDLATIIVTSPEQEGS